MYRRSRTVKVWHISNSVQPHHPPSWEGEACFTNWTHDDEEEEEEEEDEWHSSTTTKTFATTLPHTKKLDSDHYDRFPITRFLDLRGPIYPKKVNSNICLELPLHEGS